MRAFLIIASLAIAAGLAVGFWPHPVHYSVDLPRPPATGTLGPWETVGLILVLPVYFLPMIIAAARHKANLAAIAVVNLFLGWTGLGWIGALVWAVSRQVIDTVPSPQDR